MSLNKERFEAKTVEEAITNATVSLGITSDELDYEVVEKGSSGFLGLNSKNAVINVWKKSDVVEEENNEVPVEDTKEDNSVETKEETKEDSKKKNSVVDPKAADEAKVFLQDVFSSMNLTVDIKTSIYEET